MAFLARVGAWIVQILAPFFIDKIAALIKDWNARRAARKEAEDRAALDVEKLKKAKTPEEIDAGIDDSLRRF